MRYLYNKSFKMRYYKLYYKFYNQTQMSWPSWLRRQFPPNWTRVRIPGPSKKKNCFSTENARRGIQKYQKQPPDASTCWKSPVHPCRHFCPCRHPSTIQWSSLVGGRDAEYPLPSTVRERDRAIISQAAVPYTGWSQRLVWLPPLQHHHQLPPKTTKKRE